MTGTMDAGIMGHTAAVILGGGNMGGAVARGLIRSPMPSVRRPTVIEPDAAKSAALAAQGCEVYASLAEWHTRSARENPPVAVWIVLAVKPQLFDTISASLTGDITGIGGTFPDAPKILSIMAGVSIRRIRAALSLSRETCVVRAMPNLPAQIAQGTTAFACDKDTPPRGTDRAFALALLERLGPVVIETDEALLDAFTAVAGSGPAYLFLLAEAMEEGAKRMGIAPLDARRAVAQTLLGAANLLTHERTDPRSLRLAVTSTGGTTAAATEVLERAGVIEAFARAMLAARDRSRELGGPPR